MRRRSELTSGPGPERVRAKGIVSFSPETWQLRDQVERASDGGGVYRVVWSARKQPWPSALEPFPSD